MHFRSGFVFFFASLIVLCGTANDMALAGTHEWQVFDQAGQPLAGAVVTLTDGVTDAVPLDEPAVMVQRGQQFVPHTLVVPQGSPVRFPNEDRTAHHVYSFSAPKVFELELYKGDGHAPLAFDRPGVVVLGCNIHDAMRAVIFVTDAPSYGVSDASGRVLLPELPGTTQTIRVWHERQEAPAGSQSWQPGAEPPRLQIAVAAPPEPVVRGLGSWRNKRRSAR